MNVTEVQNFTVVVCSKNTKTGNICSYIEKVILSLKSCDISLYYISRINKRNVLQFIVDFRDIL